MWFQELHHGRGGNGWGMNPISYQDILAWSLLTGTITRPPEVAAIMFLDRIWLAEQAKQQAAQRSRKQPAAAKKRR